MNRFLTITLFSVCIISTAMQCKNEAIKIAQEMNLQVSPNPIPIKNSNASFLLITKLSAIKTLKKTDSLVFKLSYQADNKYVVIGSKKISTTSNWNRISNLYDTTTFKLTNFLVSDHTTLYFQMNTFKNGNKKTTKSFPISYFENEKTRSKK